jgi:hypothetical protein
MSLPTKYSDWAKVLSKFLSIEIIVQGLNVLIGIWLVRALSQKEYAYYTIAIGMLSTITLMSDSGISFGMTSIGGKVWQDRFRFGQLINTAMRMRYFLAIVSIAVVSPVLIWMLARNGAPWSYTIIITLIVLVGANFQLTSGVLMTVPRLHSQIRVIQNLDLLSNLVKFFLLGIGYLTMLNAAVATATTAAAFAVYRFGLGNFAPKKIDTTASQNPEDRQEILKIIKRTAPNTVFYCFQGQITLLLLSLFGNVQNIAEIGALGRLTLVFTIISSVLGNIILPSFARCQSHRILLKRYFLILLASALFSVFLIVLSILFPHQILWILGGKYKHLESELVLVILSAGLNFITSVMWSLNSSKAWLDGVMFQIPGTLIVQVLGIMFLNLSTLHGVILFSMCPLVQSFILNSFMSYRGLREKAMQESSGNAV